MDSIGDQIRKVDWKNDTEVISFYEANSLYFNNYQIIEDPDKISEFINIKLHYANRLFDISQFDKVLAVVEHVKELLAKLDKNHLNYDQSERHSRFLTGMVLGNKKEFKKSYPIFKQLVKEDPDHFYYKVWLDHTKLGLYSWVFNGIAVIGGGLIVADIVFRLDEKLQFDPSTIGLVILVLSYLTQRALRKYFKEKRKQKLK